MTNNRQDGVVYTLPSVGDLWPMAVITGFLCQPDQVSKTDTMGRGTRGPICGNQWSPPQSSNKRWKSHRQLFRPDWGSSVWRTASVSHTDDLVPPCPWYQFYWPGQVGVKSSDYCHLWLITGGHSQRKKCKYSSNGHSADYIRWHFQFKLNWRYWEKCSDCSQFPLPIAITTTLYIT